MRDALVIEDGNSPYVNLIVGRPGSEKDPRIQKLIAVLRSADVRAFMKRKYQGAVLPSL